MVYYVCIGINFTELKKGLKADQFEAELFFNKAYQDAQFTDVTLFLSGIENTCDHRFVSFNNLKQIEHNCFSKNKVVLYIGSILEFYKYKNSFKNCEIEIFYSENISESIGDAFEILSDNNDLSIQTKYLSNFNNYKVKDYTFDYSKINSMYKQLNDNEITMDYRKNLLFVIDETCAASTFNIVREIKEKYPNVPIDFIVLSKNNSFIDSCAQFSTSNVGIVGMLSSSELNQILQRQKLAVYLGTKQIYSNAVLRPIELEGLPFVASSLSIIRSGIRPTFCVSKIFAKENNSYSSERIINIYNSIMLADSTERKIWLRHLEQYLLREGNQSLSDCNMKNPSCSFELIDDVESVFEKPKPEDVFVLWLGRFDFIGGYGAVARGYLDAMEAVGINCLCVDINSLKPVGRSTGRFWIHDKKSNKYVLPPNAILVINDLPTKYGSFKGVNFAKKIGCTLFETDSFPIDWVEGFDFVDEVWVPTKFNYETFNFGGISKEKMSIIGYSLDTDFYKHIEKKQCKKTDPVNFLYILSNLNRKDPGLLLRSYFKAFKKEDNVCLTIKTRMSETRFYDQMKSHLPSEFFNNDNLPKVKIISETLSDDEMRNLYREADLYVTTERAKGWDYPAMEAMCMGIPTIGLDWSGSEFLSNENAYLIPVRDNLVRVHSSQVDNAEMYFSHKWADVDETKVKEALLLAYNDDELRSSKSEQCIKDSKQFAAKIVGKTIKEKLKDYSSYVSTEPSTLYY